MRLTRAFKNKISSASSGVSLIELVIVLCIIAAGATIFIANLSALKTKEKVDIMAQMLTNDLLTMRSRALSTNRAQRLTFLTASSWRLQQDNSGTWGNVSEIRQMTSDIYITSASLTNAGSNLQATPRGLYDFANGASGTPYVTISGTNIDQTRSLYVYVGGAVEKKTP